MNRCSDVEQTKKEKQKLTRQQMSSINYIETHKHLMKKLSMQSRKNSLTFFWG